MKTKKGVLPSFVAAYKRSANVAHAEKQSGYALYKEYSPAGFYVYALIAPRDGKSSMSTRALEGVSSDTRNGRGAAFCRTGKR